MSKVHSTKKIYGKFLKHSEKLTISPIPCIVCFSFPISKKKLLRMNKWSLGLESLVNVVFLIAQSITVAEKGCCKTRNETKLDHNYVRRGLTLA